MEPESQTSPEGGAEPPLDLDAIRIEMPCSASWEAMRGDERVRLCASCGLHVYDLEGFTRREAEALILRSEKRVCVRLRRRPDGTVVTADCAEVRRARRAAVRERVMRLAAPWVALGSALCAFALSVAPFGPLRATVRRWPAFDVLVYRWLPDPPRPPPEPSSEPRSLLEHPKQYRVQGGPVFGPRKTQEARPAQDARDGPR